MVATVLAARLMTVTPAHQPRTGSWWRSTSPARRPNWAASRGAMSKLRISAALPSTSPVWVASAVCASSARRCPDSVRRIVSDTMAANTSASAARTAPSGGLIQMATGSSPSRISPVVRWSRNRPSHSPNSSSVPVHSVLMRLPVG